jgi:predicted acetyltransferase
MGLTDKEFNDIIEKLSRAWRKSFSETLRDLCTEVGIEFKLTLSAQEKKEVLRKLIEKDYTKYLNDEGLEQKIIGWLESKRGKRKSE